MSLAHWGNYHIPEMTSPVAGGLNSHLGECRREVVIGSQWKARDRLWAGFGPSLQDSAHASPAGWVTSCPLGSAVAVLERDAG